MIHLKRVYDPPEITDSRRFLVDRLWPWGIKKEVLRLDGWLKDVAPSDELRRWFGHAEDRWPEFQRRYRAELNQKKELLRPLLEAARQGDITLVYGARDERHNNAIVIKACLEAYLHSAKAET